MSKLMTGSERVTSQSPNLRLGGLDGAVTREVGSLAPKQYGAEVTPVVTSVATSQGTVGLALTLFSCQGGGV
jgi:hypothetical protein